VRKRITSLKLQAMVDLSKAPRVSICLPSYNHAQYLSAAIDSILRQTYQDFEIIIVDDGSSDRSLEIAEEYALRHPSRILVLTHPEHRNLGISETVNLAYRHCRGAYWSGLPSDDMLVPDKLERQVAFLDANPKLGWVYSYARPVDEAGQLVTEFPSFGRDITKDKHPLRRLLHNNAIPGMSVLMRRSCTEKVGLHDQSLLYSDWEFWLRMTAQCPVAFLNDHLVLHRVHGYNTSGNIEPHENMKRALEVMLTFRAKAEATKTLAIDARTLALIDLQSSFYSFCLGQQPEATHSLHAAFQTDPTLAGDGKFFIAWLREKIFELTYTFEPLSPERAFASWVRNSLPSAALASLTHRVAAAELAQAALNIRETDLNAARRLSLNCIKLDPSWLLDQSLRYALLESFFGKTLMTTARHLSQASRKRLARRLAV
jgi:glycosyltransferase involved in cell wall biosynthesis